jgi:hypothetical protein
MLCWPGNVPEVGAQREQRAQRGAVLAAVTGFGEMGLTAEPQRRRENQRGAIMLCWPGNVPEVGAQREQRAQRGAVLAAVAGFGEMGFTGEARSF